MNLLTTCCVISFLASSFSLVVGQASYSITLEAELRNNVFSNYDLLQRPSETVSTKITFNLMTVNGLDIKEQKLSVSGYFYMLWTDSRLSWSGNSTYQNIPFLFSSEDYMWRPAIIVENSVSDMSVISDSNTLMRISSDGRAAWTPGGIYQTHCESDVTYYPLDTQTCNVVLSTWAYTSSEISLSLGTTAVDTTYFSENGEWQLLSVSGQETSAARESQSFSRLKFILKLRRRPLFHILNTILPVVVMATLIVMVFKLPPDSGEKIGMALTALLAYAVYLTLIADNIPKTSKTASILSIYLAIIFCLSALSVILTIVVLDLYFNIEGDEVPAWLRKFTFHVLAKFSCWKQKSCCGGRNSVTPSDDIKILPRGMMVSKSDVNDLNLNKELAKKDLEKLFTDDNEAIPEYSWKEIALIIDKCFLNLFIMLVIVSTLITFAILGAKY